MSGSFNSWALNTTVLNGEGSSSVIAVGEGSLIAISQNIIKFGEGLLISVIQEVEFFETGDGQIISIEQEIVTESSGKLITITQLVQEPGVFNFIERNGWYPILTIGGYTIPDNQIHWPINITRVENDAAQMTFTLLPPRGVQDLNQFEGKIATLDIYLSSGIGRRIYTGYVNIPDVDIINKKTTYTCSDLRREQINSQMQAVVPIVGYYDAEIFGESEDLADELDKRLSTTTLGVDFDAYGNYFISDLLPKSIPDAVFNPQDVYRDDGRDPQLQLAVRSRIVNSVNLQLTYQYPRLYYRRQFYSWEADWPGGLCGLLKSGYSLLRRDTIQNAINGAGWPSTDLEYDELPANGFYRCDGGLIGFSTVTVADVETVAVKDEEGNDVKDSSGNTKYQAEGGTFEDSRDQLAAGAQWTATSRWAQNIIETYNITIQSPQSIAKYGVVSQNDTLGVQGNFDTGNWENYTRFENPPAGGIVNGLDNIYDKDIDRYKFASAFNIGINRAKSTILKSHRENKVIFSVPINPFVELYHTIRMNGELAFGGELSAQGKVYQINHTIDISKPYAETQITLALSQSQGSGSNSALTIPPKPSSLPMVEDRPIELTSYYPRGSNGETPGLFPDPNWNGFVGNAYVTDITPSETGTAGGTTKQNTYRTVYQESFTVPTPQIPEYKRDNLTLASNASYDVAITDNLLEVEY